MIFRLFCAISLGMLAHQTDPLFIEWEKHSRRAWPQLGRYAVGVMTLALAVAIVKRDEQMLWDILATAVPVGAGVGAGYVMDSFFAPHAAE